MIARFNTKSMENNGITLTLSTDHDGSVQFVKFQCGKYTIEKSFQNTMEGQSQKEVFMAKFLTKEDFESYFKRKVKKV